MARIARASFTEIKKNLDRHPCYLVIENRSKQGLITDSAVILDRLAVFGEDPPTWTFYEDDTTGRLPLVASFEESLPERVGEIVIFGMLTDHMVFTLYKCSSGSERQTVTVL